jgi:solute carrier family 25 phosphate transporter 23/24/25/41
VIADHQRETTGSGQLTPVLRLLAGAGAGIVAMSATYPLDMVRGRLTVQEGRNVQYNGIIHAARTILREVSFVLKPFILFNVPLCRSIDGGA